MTDTPESRNQSMEVLVGYILLVGVLFSSCSLIVGLAWEGLQQGHIRLSYAMGGVNLFGFWSQNLREMSAGHFQPHLFINLGIALLLMTPYTRVAASVIYFGVVERNWKYTVITGIVFAVLTYSLFLR